MPLDKRDYKNMTDYLQHLYQCEPFSRAGIEHPVTVMYPEDWQIHDVDSLLDPTRPKPETRAFAFYDYSYLHDLQNSKPGLHDGPTFTMKLIRKKPLRLRGAIGSYYDMLATCGALERELRDAVAEGWMRAPSRASYHRQSPPLEALTRGTGRSATIGIGTLTVFNDGEGYKAILARRSAATATDSGMFHVLPAMIFQQTTADFADRREWSVKHQILREVLEELFNFPELLQPPRWDFFYDQPALRYLLRLLESGRAQLCATGIVFNLLTLRPEISTLLLIHEPEWYGRITAVDSDMPFTTADETLAGSVILAPIETDEAFLASFPRDLHLMMPAHATATMWLGIDLARREIQRTRDAAM